MADLDDSLTKLKKLQKRPDGLTNSEWRVIRKNVDQLVKRKDSPIDLKRARAKTQSDLAKLFIKWYFAIIVIVLIYVPLHNWVAVNVIAKDGFTIDLVSVRDIFMMVSGAITPILAFVLGHYFKGKD